MSTLSAVPLAMPTYRELVGNLSFTELLAVIVVVVMAGIYLVMAPNVTPTRDNPLIDLRPLHITIDALVRI
jgi:hypothetical protein